MNKLYIRIFTAILAAILAVLMPERLQAQADVAYDTFSPYSMYGIGNLETLGGQNSLAMGGIAIGDRNSAYINWVNPAAVTARENRAFMFDFGVTQKNIFYSADASTSTEQTGSGKLLSVNNIFNIHHILVSLPLSKRIAFKAGLMPFATTGYEFVSRERADEVLLEMGDVEYDKMGKGGTYQIVLGAGWSITDNLSIGVDGLYYLGNTIHSSSADFTTNTHYREIARSWSSVSRGFGAKAGVQYTARIKPDLALTLGATYKIGSKMGGEYTDLTIASTTNSLDTIANAITKLDYLIPAEIGAGFTLRKTDKWMFGFDYIMQDWSKTVFTNAPGIDVVTRRMQQFRLGGEITPNKYDIRHYAKNITYRAGVFYNPGYLAVNGTPINNYGITFGAGFPFNNRYTSLALSVEVGRNGTLANNLVLENYVKINVGLNLFDLWFHKSLYR